MFADKLNKTEKSLRYSRILGSGRARYSPTNEVQLNELNNSIKKCTGIFMSCTRHPEQPCLTDLTDVCSGLIYRFIAETEVVIKPITADLSRL